MAARRLQFGRLACAAVLPGLLVCNPALAEMKVKRSVHAYDIKGTTARQLINQMGMLGPLSDKDGGRYWARARWYVKYNYSYQYNPKSCWITGVDTDVTIDYVFANWLNHDQAPESLQRSWDRNFAGLKKHEEMHGQHAIDAAEEVMRGIGNLKPYRNCDALEAEAYALGQAIIQKHSDRDDELDRKTDHGSINIPPLSD